MPRHSPYALAAALFLLATTPLALWAQDTLGPQPIGELLPGPSCGAIPEWYSHDAATACTPAERAVWLEDMQHWRMERRIRVGFDPSQYTRPELQWTQSSFVQPQMMIHDRFFYDPATRRYTVDRYLNDLDQRYGGIDSVLLWPTYPNIGIDDRNQYDLVHDLPGGIAGVRQLVDDFHQHHVRVFFPVMLWDQGTRAPTAEEGASDAEALSRELTTLNADGINGDTLEGIPHTFRTASDALHHPLALEPELGPASDEMLADNTMSWGYWKYDFIPGISRSKWIEPRHMVNISNRWAHSHLDDLQFAFFNGVGFESWENVWGIWNQLTPRDAESLRRIATIERATAPLLVSQQWEPHTPVLNFGVFASKWPGDTSTLWTIINRNHFPVTGRQLTVPSATGTRYFDLWHGVELHPAPSATPDQTTLTFDLDPDGFGAILTTTQPDTKLEALLTTMHQFSAQPLSSLSSVWTTLPQQLVPIAPTKPPNGIPAGMVKIPATTFNFRVNGIELEGSNDEGVDVPYPGEPSARRFHDLVLPIAAFWIDTYPVTNAQFKRFLDATHYHPADDHNFLKNWASDPTSKLPQIPAGAEDQPVTWVSLEDARAFAHWTGKRLPHEWEWQYAAQGTDARVYPWGNDWQPSAVPTPDTGRTMQSPSDVHAHSTGASPFGVQDLVGNVWQWTDEYTDDHTRAAILRGGSHYQPQGSRWYFPQAYKLSQHGKYLLMAPSLDRSSAIGFRCAQDAEEHPHREP